MLMYISYYYLYTCIIAQKEAMSRSINTGGGTIMFLTIGFIVGFIAGWWVNEKVENLGDKLNPIKWFKKKD